MNDTPPITALDREAAVSTVCDDGSHFAYMMTDGILSGRMDDTLLVQAFARHRTAAERATSPAGDAGEVERLRKALEIIRLNDRKRNWTATKDNPESHWVEYEGQFAKIAANALRPQAGDADVVGEPGA